MLFPKAHGLSEETLGRDKAEPNLFFKASGVTRARDATPTPSMPTPVTAVVQPLALKMTFIAAWPLSRFSCHDLHAAKSMVGKPV